MYYGHIINTNPIFGQIQRVGRNGFIVEVYIDGVRYEKTFSEANIMRQRINTYRVTRGFVNSVSAMGISNNAFVFGVLTDIELGKCTVLTY